jgi:peptide/nickel transport system ATP-binding protein
MTNEDVTAGRGTTEVILRVNDLVVEFNSANGEKVRAVSGVSFDIKVGETVGLVGESGCGKSTVARCVAQHIKPSRGTIEFEGKDISRLDAKARRRLRTRLQMIFQDPLSSLNPRRTIEAQIAEGLRIWGVGREEREARVRRVMEPCGLKYQPELRRRPRQFSGGQCQRIAIARALVLEPSILICDESVSALDVSVQAQVLNLLMDMRERFGLSMLFISHDLAVVDQVSDRVIVMYLGKICEIGTPDELFDRPLHHYTKMLTDARPDPDEYARDERSARPASAGEIPSPVNPPSGCRFRTRCPRAEQRCADEEPLLQGDRPGHMVACHFPLSRTSSGEGRSASPIETGRIA